MRKYVFLMFILLSLAACASNQQSQVNDGSVELGLAQTDDSSETITPVSQEPAQNQMGGIGQGMGRSGGMMARHHATVPETYVSVVNPGSDEESLARGAEIYAAHCAVCHGDGGMGDGVAAKGFDPAPAAVAHTSQMLGDDYLFWRISDGGAAEPFSSAMPAWKNVLAEDARWDVINYVRALGAGTVMPGRGMGGMRYDPDGELQMRTMMLATAVSPITPFNKKKTPAISISKRTSFLGLFGSFIISLLRCSIFDISYENKSLSKNKQVYELS